jgi:N6-L-threonylcarbamoyladenine synthase
MILLSIETSCDETAISILQKESNSPLTFSVLSHKVLSQATMHQEFGGVFPSLAKREHAKALPYLLALCLKEAKLLDERKIERSLSEEKLLLLDEILRREEEMKNALLLFFSGINKPKIDAIAVTSGPGLAPALWVGISCATALSSAWNIPLYEVNHIEGHVISALLKKKGKKTYEIQGVEYPSLAFIASGGHTEIVRLTSERKYEILGETKDDAIGEAFDKVARLLGLSYPGGPEIGRLAEKARRGHVVPRKEFILPRPMIQSKDLYFSMSGLKTSVLTKVKACEEVNEEAREELSLEFENAVTDVVYAKIKQAIYETRAKTLLFGGGVSANTHLREMLVRLAKEESVELYLPDKEMTGDNALMIGAVGLLMIALGHEPAEEKIVAKGTWRLRDL